MATNANSKLSFYNRVLAFTYFTCFLAHVNANNKLWLPSGWRFRSTRGTFYLWAIRLIKI